MIGFHGRWAWVLLGVAFACGGGTRSRPRNPEPAKAPDVPSRPIPPVARARPPPPPLPGDLLSPQRAEGAGGAGAESTP